ncbi:MAG TPA: carbon-nitrogen hydrolase family protein [Candidatus Nitrosotenuis sp.]|nr:carbon-nitrogen hydrolase family protein [Candidatus Nitrosotenuis sp.]
MTLLDLCTERSAIPIMIKKKSSCMIKLGIIQTRSYLSNQQGVKEVSKLLMGAGKANVDVVCLPEQWLVENRIDDFDTEFSMFKKIAKEYQMTIIPGAFYRKKARKWHISAPVIGDSGEIVGIQDKIHPFSYERDLVAPGREATVFHTKCRFGIIICYDMVFSDVAETLVKKGAEVLLSPSRIVRRGIQPWHMYIQVRALENRVPILAANVQNHRFGGKSIIVDLTDNHGIMLPQVQTVKRPSVKSSMFDLSKHKKSRLARYHDHKRFQ